MSETGTASRRRAAAVSLLVAALCWPAATAGELDERVAGAAELLRERALADGRAHELLGSLTSEVGPRLAGTPGDAAAVAWARATLERLGFERVRAEPVPVPRWDRGTLELEIAGPAPIPLAGTMLGGSVGTGEEGITARVVRVASLDALDTLPRDAVRGAIVYIADRMERSVEGDGYRAAVEKRVHGASRAGALGAAAVIIRSAGTDRTRFPHTGGMRYDDDAPEIPAVAVSNPDADLLDRRAAAGIETVVRLRSTARRLGSAVSANVIGEIPGRESPDEIVLLGAHLDSWDVGTGAQDDGAGVVIVTMAATLIAELDVRPRRTLRVVLFANEEFGLDGARAYAVEHEDEIGRHVVALEADLGAGRVWEFSSRVDPGALPLVDAIAARLEPLGIVRGDNEGWGGADIGVLRERGVPVLQPRQDASPYFDVHHTDNDTLAMVDPALLRQNVAAFAVAAWIAAADERDFGRLPPEP